MALLFCLPAVALVVYREGVPERIFASVWILACGIFALDSVNGWYLAIVVSIIVVILSVVWLV
ncbi:MAG: hypothetical protein ACOCXA_05700 [Planctomycetota bacterium]